MGAVSARVVPVTSEYDVEPGTRGRISAAVNQPFRGLSVGRLVSDDELNEYERSPSLQHRGLATFSNLRSRSRASGGMIHLDCVEMRWRKVLET
jgi:hypothetical protein